MVQTQKQWSRRISELISNHLSLNSTLIAYTTTMTANYVQETTETPHLLQSLLCSQ